MKVIVALAGRPRFSLGQIVGTPGALEACSPKYLAECLSRHARGDWGLVYKEDAASNERAVKTARASPRPSPSTPQSRAKGLAKTRSGSSPNPTAA